MTASRKLKIGMSLAPTWLSGEGWRRPDSGVEDLFFSDFYLDIARRAEAACLDFVFRPDTLFLRPEVLDKGPGFTSLDPTVLLASIARETTHIGLLSTISASFLPPYIIARQLQTLNWLSKGRAGWNIVTALEGQENFGLKDMPSAEERYEHAAEVTGVVKALWDSYPHETLRMDRATGTFADPAMVGPIGHQGTHVTVSGPLNIPAFGKGRIPLVQAGASPTGRDFAASVADAVFASTPDKAAAIELRHDLRRRAEAHGRSSGAVRLMPGLSLYLAETRKEAEDLFAETHARADRGRQLAAVSRMLGLDLSTWPGDRRVTSGDLPAPPASPRSRTHAELLFRLIEREAPTVSELLARPEVIGSGHWQIIGTVDDAFEAIRDWSESGAIDGFIALPGGSVGSMHLALERLMPRLVDAALLREAYRGTTFLDHLSE